MSYSNGDVSLRSPDSQAVRRAAETSDVADHVEEWLQGGLARDDVYYFSIYEGNVLVGQIFLHDIDLPRRTSLVGYHLFLPMFRDCGIGTKALKLLQRFVTEQTELCSLVAITRRDNLASQGIARRCGFIETGAPWEDPVHGVVLRWDVPEWLDTPCNCPQI